MNVFKIVPLVDLVLICQTEDADLIVVHIPLLDVDIHLALLLDDWTIQNWYNTKSCTAVVHN